ncbi:MAG: hypothetical protein IJS12_02245 [Lachnospiraceae bacterium]|nr:hypothetical protein [Lachnospiraceae bacterium]
MDGKSIFEQDLLKKEVKMNEGILNVDKKDEMIGRNSFMDISAIDMKDVQDQDDSFDDLIIKDNKELVKTGKMLLKEFDEKEIIMGERLSIESFKDSPLATSATRRRRFGEYPRLMGQGQVAAGDLLGRNTSKVVKRGGFGNDMIAKGQEFVRRIKSWATASDIQDAILGDFVQQYGVSDIIDCLYVDGMPIREFVAGKYAYNGSEDKAQERNILSAYAAMIASRRNHPITLVRPVLINGVADIDIRNVGVDMRIDGHYTSRRQKTDAIRYGIEGDRYREYCETAYRSDMRAKAGEALRAVKGKTVNGLSKLQELKRNLNAAGKGKHNNYDKFVMAFNRYFDVLQDIGRDPDHMDINRNELQMIYDLNTAVLNAAHAYLKGKKMNLPRHHAVKDISDLMSAQSGTMWGLIRGEKLNAGNPTVNLKELLDPEKEGFTLVGLSDEIEDYSMDQTINGSNNIEYVKVDDEVELALDQKKAIRIHRTIFSDDTTLKAYQKLVNGHSDDNMDVSSRMVLAGTFLKSAANTLYNDERFRKEINKRYAYATDNKQYLLCMVAREQLTKVLTADFRNYPELRDAMESWNEEVVAQEADYMTYKSNVLGDKVTAEEFKKYGGSVRHRYVTPAEANEAIASSKNYLCVKKVEGKKGMYELRPSMPEYATLNLSQPLEKPIPLRKTFKAVYKTIANIIMDEKGNIKNNIGLVNGESVTRRIDEMLMALPETKADLKRAGECAELIIRPAMEKMLAADYKRRGTKNATAKAREDAEQICRDFMTLVQGNRGPLVSSFDATFHDFRLMMDMIAKTSADDLMKEPRIRDYKIDGVAPTRAEVEEAYNEVKKEYASAREDFLKLRNMDLDDEEVPCMSSCNEHSRGTQVLMLSHTDNGSYDSVAYNLADKAKSSPDEILDYMVTNMEMIFATGFGDARTVTKHRKRLNELNESKKKNGQLTKEEVSDLKGIFRNYVKYDYHRGANMGQSGNAQYTSETFALEPDQVIQSPLTFNVCIGKYKSDLDKQNIDDEGGFIEHEGMKKFYEHDNGLEYCNSRKKLIKGMMKDVLKVKVSNIRDQY